MRFRSTRSREVEVGSFREAVLQGLAPDGGLFEPVEFPRPLGPDSIEAWRRLPYADLAFEIFRLFLDDDDPSEDEMRTILKAASLDFENPEEWAPLVFIQDRSTNGQSQVDVTLEGRTKEVEGEVEGNSIGGSSPLDLTSSFKKYEGRIGLLQAYQGPSFSFKDYAMCILSRLMQHYLKREDLLRAKLSDRAETKGGKDNKENNKENRAEETCSESDLASVTALHAHAHAHPNASANANFTVGAGTGDGVIESHDESNGAPTVLVATSGDTGSAVIAAVRHTPCIRCFVLYPHEKVSQIQRLQMTTVDAPNISCLAVKGTFDDCQNLLKKAFENTELKRRCRLTAMNSVNFGRIVCQIVYYYRAYYQMTEGLSHAGQCHAREVDFVVPTGNFGNVLAGYYAKKLGLPIGKLVIASNVNDVLTDLINRGQCHRTSVVPTIAPSIDIQVSSNFERLLADKHTERLPELYETFRSSGLLVLPRESLAHIQKDFVAFAVRTESAILDTIKSIHKDYNIVIDPHTAVAVHATHQYIAHQSITHEPITHHQPGHTNRHTEGEAADDASVDKDITLNKAGIVIISTAHPAKFPRGLSALFTQEEVDKLTPSALRAVQSKPERFTISPMEDTLKQSVAEIDFVDVDADGVCSDNDIRALFDAVGYKVTEQGSRTLLENIQDYSKRHPTVSAKTALKGLSAPVVVAFLRKLGEPGSEVLLAKSVEWARFFLCDGGEIMNEDTIASLAAKLKIPLSDDDARWTLRLLSARLNTSLPPGVQEGKEKLPLPDKRMLHYASILEESITARDLEKILFAAFPR